MSNFLNGFEDELTKLGVAGLGALKSVGRFAYKHPLLTVGAGATVLGTGMAARQGYRSGMSGEGKERYLAAGIDPYSGRAMPSGTAYKNYNALFGKKEDKGISKHYKEKAFK